NPMPKRLIEQAGEASPGHLGGERHAHAVGKALTERPGGYLHPGREVVFRVARGLALPLTKALQLVERQVVARQVEERIDEHRAVARRQDEAIAIWPLGIAWIKPQEARP